MPSILIREFDDDDPARRRDLARLMARLSPSERFVPVIPGKCPVYSAEGIENELVRRREADATAERGTA